MAPVRYLGTRVTDDPDGSHVATGNKNWILCKSNTCSKPPLQFLITSYVLLE